MRNLQYLNPIERLWKWMKERVIYNTYYEHFEEFKAAVLGFFAVLSALSGESIGINPKKKFHFLENAFE